MLFSQVIEESQNKWLNINPHCIYFFLEHKNMNAYERIQEKVEQIAEFHCKVIVRSSQDGNLMSNPSDETFNYFFSRSIVARVFPWCKTDFLFLGEAMGPAADVWIIDMFVEKLREYNRQNRMRRYRCTAEELPYFVEKEVQMLCDDGVWSIEESDAFVEEIVKPKRRENRYEPEIRDNANTPSWGHLLQKKVSSYGRRNNADGWYHLQYKHDLDDVRCAPISFETPTANILYHLFLLHPDLHIPYEELFKYKNEIAAIAEVLFGGQREDEEITVFVNRLIGYDGTNPLSVNNLSQATNKLNKSLAKSLGEAYQDYTLKMERLRLLRVRYISIPEDNIHLLQEFVQEVSRLAKMKYENSPQAKAERHAQSIIHKL